jgi:hypothetical protein
MAQRDTLFGHGKAVMKAQMQELTRMVNGFVCNDEQL